MHHLFMSMHESLSPILWHAESLHVLLKERRFKGEICDQIISCLLQAYL